jgi:hypothetical protein
MNQSVERLATGWTVRGSNSGMGQIFLLPSRPTIRPTQPPIKWVPCHPRVKRQWRGVNRPPHLPPKLKKE